MNKALVTIIAAGIAGTASADSISETNPAVIDWGFAGTGPVTDGPAILYPSEITVAGAAGAIIDVNITMNDGAHTWADDMDVVLQSPSGTRVNIWANAGGGDDVQGSVTFDDQAAAPIDDATGGNFVAGTGVFQTSVYGTDDLNGASDGTLLSLFNGEDANGTWSLFVYDSTGADTGAFQGWTLDIETIPAPASAALLGLGGLAAARRRR